MCFFSLLPFDKIADRMMLSRAVGYCAFVADAAALADAFVLLPSIALVLSHVVGGD